MNLYVVRNKENGKCYVGQTKYSVQKRLKDHQSKNGSILGKAMRKYGEEAFDVFVFAEIPVAVIDVFEIQMIALMDSGAPNGYNLQLGGRGKGVAVSDTTIAKMSESHLGYEMPAPQKQNISDALIGKKKTLEHVENMSKAQMGKTFSVETRKKISNSLMGNVPWNKGLKIWSEEQKEKNAAAHRGKKASAETKQKMSLSQRAKLHPNSRAVICVETGKVFQTVRAAAAEVKLSRASISNCCTRRHKTCAGYHWRYAKESV